MPSWDEDALDRCLARRRAGEQTEACLADLDPGSRAEIEALLAVGEAVRDTPRPGLPPSALAANERRILTRAAALRPEGISPAAAPGPSWWGSRGWRSSFVPAAIVLVVVLSLGLLTGMKTVVASAGPDDTLYPFKRSLEQAQVALAPTLEQRAQAQVDIAQSRIDEMAGLVRQRRSIPAWLIEQAEAAITNATQLTEQLPDDAAVAVLRRSVGLLSYERVVLGLAADATPDDSQSAVASGLRATAATEQGISATLTRRAQPASPTDSSATTVPPSPVPPSPVRPTAAPATDVPRVTVPLTAPPSPSAARPTAVSPSDESATPAPAPDAAPTLSPPEAPRTPVETNAATSQTSTRPTTGSPGPESREREQQSAGAGEAPEPRRDNRRPAEPAAPPPTSPPVPAPPERSVDPPRGADKPAGRAEGKPRERGADVSGDGSASQGNADQQAPAEKQDRTERPGQQDSNSPSTRSGGTVNPGSEAGDDRRREQGSTNNGQGGSNRAGATRKE